MSEFEAAPPPPHQSDNSDGHPDFIEEEKPFLPGGDVDQLLNQERLPDKSLLGWPTVVLIIANRMIGSGIFNTPSTLMQLTQSVGVTMLFWVAGAVTTLGGTLMFMEFGLTSPRFAFQGDSSGAKLPLPRSGGELHYLKDVLRRPAFFTVCLYGIAFILLGNIATNSLAFGVKIFEAAARPEAAEGWPARIVALVMVAFACLIHGTWRSGGIYLNNILALIKIAMLLLIFITGCLAWGGIFKRDSAALDNLTAPNAFKNPSSDAYAFADAYLSIVFAYGGFNQANYILAEVKSPKKNYKWPMFFTVLGLSILYLFVNLAYMAVVPAEEQKAGVNVATRFFELTYGTLSSKGKEQAPRVLAAFMAISSLGNIVVNTYTAARVKQEIAKEGILPFYKFLANNRAFLGFKDPVPVGALALHGAVSAIIILATSKIEPLNAYKIMVNLYSYTIDACTGVALALGVIALRLRSRSWRENSFLPPWLSIGAAVLYGLSMAFPVCASWVPPSQDFLNKMTLKAPWFTTATVGICCLAAGFAWWGGFRLWAMKRRPGRQLTVVRELLLTPDDELMEHERIQLIWSPERPDLPTMREVGYIVNGIAPLP